MWQMSDHEKRKERRLPGEGLDISWVMEATKKTVTDWFYAGVERLKEHVEEDMEIKGQLAVKKKRQWYGF